MHANTKWNIALIYPSKMLHTCTTPPFGQYNIYQIQIVRKQLVNKQISSYNIFYWRLADILPWATSISDIETIFICQAV